MRQIKITYLAFVGDEQLNASPTDAQGCSNGFEKYDDRKDREVGAIRQQVSEDNGLNLTTTVGWDQGNKVSRRQRD